MEPDGQHFLQDARRRLNVLDACFDRPRTKVRNIFTLPDGDREILMPEDSPVTFRRLVEHQAAHKKCLFAEYWLNQLHNTSVAVQRPDFGYHFRHISDGVNTAPISHGSAVFVV